MASWISKLKKFEKISEAGRWQCLPLSLTPTAQLPLHCNFSLKQVTKPSFERYPLYARRKGASLSLKTKGHRDESKQRNLKKNSNTQALRFPPIYCNCPCFLTYHIPPWLSALHQTSFKIFGSSPGWCSSMDWVRACEPKGFPFPVRAHAWVVGQVPSRGCARGNHTYMFLSLSFSLFL